MDNQTPAPAQNTVSMDGVSDTFGSYAAHRWWMILIGLTVAAIALLKIPIISFFIIILGLYFLKNAYESTLFKAFAAANNYSFAKSGQLQELGIIFSIGHSRKFKDIVTGNYKQWPFELFLYSYTIGGGKSSQTFIRAVMKVSFNVSVQPFLLKRNSFGGALTDEGESVKAAGYSQKVGLEGDFDKHFGLHIRPNTQDDVLSILTPDFMQMLIPLDKYEVEMSANGDFYVYAHKMITKKQQLLDVYTIIESIIPKINAYTERVKRLHAATTPSVAPTIVVPTAPTPPAIPATPVA